MAKSSVDHISGSKTLGTWSPRGRLQYFGPVTRLRLSVWPLGGAKGFYLTLDISVVFEQVAVIFTRYGSTAQGLQIPHISEGLPPPVWGSPSPQKNFWLANFSSYVRVLGLKFCTAVRRAVPLRCPYHSLGSSAVWGSLFLFQFLEYFHSFWRPHLYTWRPRSTSIRCVGLSGPMFVLDTFLVTGYRF